MTIGWGLLAWAVIAWLAPLMYVLLKNECKPKKNIIVGVTLPLDAQQDPEVQAVLARFQKGLRLACWVSLALILPTLPVRSFGLFLTLYLTWIVAAPLLFFLPYIRCNKALRALKDARGWRRGGPPQTVVDLRAAAAQLRWLSPWWFLPPLLIALLPLCFERTMWPLWLPGAAMVPVSYICYRFLYRNRAEVVDENTDRTLALTCIRRYNWGRLWAVMAWASGALNVGLWLTLDHPWLCAAAALLYGVALCAQVIGVELRVRRLQERLGNSRDGYVDEDERWIWGQLYYNPDDRRVLVNDRVGVGSTLNLARRPAQAVSAVCLALVLACPLIGVWVMRMEQAPVELEVTDAELVGTHFGGRWSVALEDIRSVELLQTRPTLLRVSGTGMDSALTGTFRNEEWGRLTCCLDPRTGPWLLVTQTDGRLSLFGASAQGQAEHILSELRQRPARAEP